MVLAVFVATVLIANICKGPDGPMDISATLLGAGIGTLIYQIITRFKSPMFISSCGATVSAVCGALALGTTNNYLMVICGGAVILLIYAIFALVIKLRGIESINKVFPPSIVGAITIVIGLNLAKFLVTYCGQYGLWDTTKTYPEQLSTLLSANNIWYIVIALITMFTTALFARYGKGFLKNIPFLFGLLAGYIVAVVVTYAFDIQVWDNAVNAMRPLVDFDKMSGIKFIELPHMAFTKVNWDTQWSWSYLGSTILLFAPVGICALLEHYSDHRTLSNIIGTNLTEQPGLSKTLLGDGVASFLGTTICGLPNTSYGESVATIGFSRVASVIVTTVAALILVVLSFFPPVAALINTIPSCVFGGCAMILYGYIAASGLKTIINNKVDLEDSKNLIIVSVVLTVGVSGISFLVPAFGAVSLAMILGVILNLILKSKKDVTNA